jgi:hypothetical protein
MSLSRVTWASVRVDSAGVRPSWRSRARRCWSTSEKQSPSRPWSHSTLLFAYCQVGATRYSGGSTFSAAISAHREPGEVVTDRAYALKLVICELLPAVFQKISPASGSAQSASIDWP